MRKRIFFTIFLSLFCVLTSADANSILKRDILVLYDSTEGVSSDDNDVHKMVETVLNYFGMAVVYRDASKPLPSDTQRFRAIICNFNDTDLTQLENFWKWLERQLTDGIKVIFWGSIPAVEKGRLYDFEVINAVLKLMGLNYQPTFTNNPEEIEVLYKDKRIFDFETRLEQPSFIEGISSISSKNQVYLKVKNKKTGETVDLVTAGPLGGVAYGSCLFFERFDRVRLWAINPFNFFKEVLGINSPLPIPDVTTLNGRRIFFSHIDGDGFSSFSHISRNKICAEIIRDEILEKYALPITISIIAGEFLPEYQRDEELRERLIKVANEIFSFPHVEVASHTYSHPFNWSRLQEDEGHNLSIPGYTFSPEKEVKLSVNFINQFLTDSRKKVRILLWTGDCLPQEEAILHCEDIGLANMNGGETRKDRAFPSYSNLDPLYRQVGSTIQFYAQAQNENTYTNLWMGPYWGFKNVIYTFQNTDTPFRIKPMNIYYHFYSGERRSSLQALKSVYDWALKQPIALIWASEFVQVVKDFISMKIEYLPDGGFFIKNKGWCRTIRFDHVKDVHPDLQKSKGILGFIYGGDCLYIHLDDSQSHTIYLTSARPATPYLKEATHWVNQWKMDKGDIFFTCSGYGEGRFVLAGFKPNRIFKIRLEGEDKEIRCDEKGRLFIRTFLDGGPRSISIKR